MKFDVLIDYIIKVLIIDNFVLYYLILYGLNMINNRKTNLHEGYYEMKFIQIILVEHKNVLHFFLLH